MTTLEKMDRVHDRVTKLLEAGYTLEEILEKVGQGTEIPRLFILAAKKAEADFRRAKEEGR